MTKKKAEEPEAEAPDLSVEPEEVVEPEDKTEALIAKPKDTSGDGKLKRLWHGYTSKKKITIPATFLVVVLIVLAVPLSRYKVLGLFMQKNFTVTVLDSETGKPVSQADVKLATKTAKTNEKGEAVVSDAPLGKQKLAVTKKYYKDLSADVTVVLTDSKNKTELKMEATGRQIPVAVVNKITGKGVAGAVVTVLDSEAKTNDTGEAVLVLPADKKTEKATVKLEGYNDLTADINVEQTIKLSISPAGKVYFLSKQSGKIDVVKTNLDGSDRQVVLAGTGKEDAETTLLSSRDWKYLALKSRRDGDKSKLYLIETATDKLTTMDEGNAFFDVKGWDGNHFIYKVDRQDKYPTDNKKEALKSYNAASKQIVILDESTAEIVPGGFFQALFNEVYLLNGKVVYTTNVSVGNSYNTTIPKVQPSIISIKPDGSNKKVLKAIPAGVYYQYWRQFYITARLEKPQELYFTAYQYTKNEAFELEEDTFKDTSVTAEDGSKPYNTYILSPSGKRTFWAESRDGKSTLFLGTATGEEPDEVARLSELTPYGWFSEDYLLTSKKGSELYIQSTAKDAAPFKVTDYHRSNGRFEGYGGGYGGF
ncbi:MAG TPA: hypothetical protein VK694_02405 [Verrucomicrobiae bacterium]|nr:hypothetical protein [Verrucomicrobiae bacterium]